ncbi:hypothetical protein GCM10007918_11690 [Piscinibacter gummiphilus]|nr:hypothetical protein GCM10007918_11690 [Piscinibacter gummiphilus]
MLDEQVWCESFWSRAIEAVRVELANFNYDRISRLVGYEYLELHNASPKATQTQGEKRTK